MELFVDNFAGGGGASTGIEMTDNEIIKALESLLDRMRAYESGQPTIGKGLVTSIISMIEKKDKLIEIADKKVESLKAEVKRLKFRKCLYSGLYSEHDTVLRDCTQGECFHSVSEEAVRLEAIKEFAERLKEKFSNEGYMLFDYEKDIIDNLLKEMVDDDNA